MARPGPDTAAWDVVVDSCSVRAKHGIPDTLLTLPTAPTQRDCHILAIAEKGRMAWQRISGYNVRAGVESQWRAGRASSARRCASIPIRRRLPRPPIGVVVLNRMLALGRTNSVRVA